MKRNVVRTVCILIALCCFGYLGFYYYQMKRNAEDAAAMEELSKRSDHSMTVYTPPEPEEDKAQEEEEGGKEEPKERRLYVLGQYQSLYEKNKNFIGWIAIDGTNINYPVMKSIYGNGEFYLDHNFDGEEDKNGTLFMDDDCDIIRPSENWIIYGHNMKSGKMFGDLTDYKSEAFYREHPVVKFDTIYEQGIYDVMYAFESRVYQESTIAFKYYQFIDPASEAEFDSAMREMAADSFYDTGVTAQYGDRLLLLSTCDYNEDNGRFVVVCRRRD
ncbi:MAG: class B sortase [Lachnospiraceae bacterium]|nr:class B sortase [Lachnospiraceae bacterium]